MSFSFHNHFITASLALIQGSSLALDAERIEPVKHRQYCRWNRNAKTAYTKERRAWESLANSFKTEDWNRAFNPEQLSTFQIHLVQRYSSLRSRIRGIRLIITWLFYGMRYISLCKQLTATMQALSKRLNSSESVIQGVLGELKSKKVDAFVQDFFPEKIKKTALTEKEFLKASDFFFIKKSSGWQVHYLDPSSGQLAHSSKTTAIKLKELHSKLISTQFLKNACKTPQNHPKIQFEYTDEANRRPDIGQRNLVVVNTSANCFFMDSTGRIAEFNIPYSASEEILKIKWEELINKVAAERDYEDRFQTYKELLDQFSNEKALRFINRVDQEPASRDEFLASHEIGQESQFTDLIHILTINPTAKYTTLNVFYINPHDCALTFQNIPITCDVESLKKSLEAIQSDNLKQFEAFTKRVKELETDKNIKFAFTLTAVNCQVTLSKTIALSAELTGTVTRSFNGFSLERLHSTVKNLSELQRKFDRVPRILSSTGVKFVLNPTEIPANSESCYACYKIVPGSIQIEIHYSLLSLDQPVRQALSFEDPDSLEKALDKLREIMYLERNFTLESATLTELSKFTSVEIPPPVPGIVLSKSFTQAFKEIVWDISDLKQEGKIYTPERFFYELNNIVSRVEHFLTHGFAERDALKAVPDFRTHPEDHKKYFRDLHSLLTHIIQGLQNANNRETTKQILINLCVAGSWCGGRWMGEAISCYNQLSNEIRQVDKQPLQEQILFWIDQFKSNALQSMASEAGQSTHTYLSFAKRLSMLGVAKFPGAGAAMYEDPYSSHYRDLTDAALESAFKKRCSASEIILNCLENIETALSKESAEIGGDLFKLFIAAAEPLYVPIEGESKSLTIDSILSDQGYWPYTDETYMERRLTAKGCGLLLSHLGRVRRKT